MSEMPHPDPPARSMRNIWLMTIAAILMNSCMVFIWCGVLLLLNPSVQKRCEEFAKAVQPGFELAQNESELQKQLDAMAPILNQVNWFAVALLTALMAFSALGFAYGRLSGQAEWLGWLPFFGILSGQNPALIADELGQRGIPSAQLPLWQQVVIFAVELVTVYSMGSAGAWLHRRKRSKYTRS